jgi:hypothetical protein
MARASIAFVRGLIRWGQASPENRAKLQTWLDETVAAIAENRGGHVTSGSANGVSFTQLPAMTNAEWFEVLDQVIQHIDNGTLPTTRTVGRIG